MVIFYVEGVVFHALWRWDLGMDNAESVSRLKNLMDRNPPYMVVHGMVLPAI